MGQNLETMRQQQQQRQSKDELLYNFVLNGNAEAVKALCREGAPLEWIDRDGKTPLIAACLNSDLYNVAKTLVQVGANVNAYRPGRHAGTPLHHAAKRGLDETVKLLLIHGANALVRNDDCQTPLDVARAKGFTHVARMIEDHICYFSGWLREFHGPGFLGAVASQLLSKKIWAVVIPCGPSNLTKPQKMELLIYNSLQDVQPRSVISLCKATIEEPKFHKVDPALIIHNKMTKSRYKLASGSEGDKRQLHCLFNACRGIPQVQNPPPISDNPASVAETRAQIGVQAEESSNSNGWFNQPPAEGGYNGWGIPEPAPTPSQNAQTHDKIHPPPDPTGNSASPSAPPVPEEFLNDGPIHYPTVEHVNSRASVSSCAICWEAPIEGACVPCGHMAGCMPCLNEIKSRGGDCPVCRGKMDQVIRLYAI